MKITVILDPAFGASNDGVPTPAYWIIDSPDNRSLSDRMRGRGSGDPNSAVFDGGRFASLADAAIHIFPTVAEHHPCWTEMEFIGVILDDRITEGLAGDGIQFAPTPAGFIVTNAQGA